GVLELELRPGRDLIGTGPLGTDLRHGIRTGGAIRLLGGLLTATRHEERRRQHHSSPTLHVSLQPHSMSSGSSAKGSDDVSVVFPGAGFFPAAGVALPWSARSPEAGVAAGAVAAAATGVSGSGWISASIAPCSSALPWLVPIGAMTSTMV